MVIVAQHLGFGAWRLEVGRARAGVSGLNEMKAVVRVYEPAVSVTAGVMLLIGDGLGWR